MAEFCYECFKETFDVDLQTKKVFVIRRLELCEGCGEYKHVVVSVGGCGPLRYLLLKLFCIHPEK